MKNGTALSSYLLAPTQEEEVVELCSEESPEKRVLITHPRQGRGEGEDLKGVATSLGQEIQFTAPLESI